MVSQGGGPGPKRARPWQVERPGAAAARQSATDELFTLVAFDVPCDKARRKVGEMCKDYGLSRTQWSVFEGPMTRNRREELSARLEKLLKEAEGGGRVAVFPIGQREVEWALRVVTKGTPVKAVARGSLAAGAKAGGDDG
jgi:CRISPR-associated protein Cas2